MILLIALLSFILSEAKEPMKEVELEFPPNDISLIEIIDYFD